MKVNHVPDTHFVPEGDERCGYRHKPTGATCLLARGHGGPHRNTQGYWSTLPQFNDPPERFPHAEAPVRPSGGRMAGGWPWPERDSCDGDEYHDVLDANGFVVGARPCQGCPACQPELADGHERPTWEEEA